MKALRKKYGKRKWEDTPNSAWWHKQRKQGAELFGILANAHAYQAHASIQQISQTPVSDVLSQLEKNLALADCVIASQNGIAQIWTKYGKPPPKNSR